MSPPADDSSFFSLRYGLQRKPNESMYDRINKELGLTVEVRYLIGENILKIKKEIKSRLFLTACHH